MPGLSIGLMSAAQGSYTAAQLLLDITQGARISTSSYSPGRPPALALRAVGQRAGGQAVSGQGMSGQGIGGQSAVGQDGSGQSAVGQDGSGQSAFEQGATVEPWPAVVKRVRGVPQDLRPGLLASSIPGGAGYVGAVGTDHVDAVAAADERGHVAALSVGPAATLTTRIAELSMATPALSTRHSTQARQTVLARQVERAGQQAIAGRTKRTGLAGKAGRKRLIVADLAPGASGAAELRALSGARMPGELEIVVQRADGTSGNELLWVALAGLGGGHTLTSQTTNQQGLIAAIDLAPTILHRLDLPVPSAMRGKPIETAGTFDSPDLRAVRERLLVLYPRRLPALALLLGVWTIAALAARLLPFGPRPYRSGAPPLRSSPHLHSTGPPFDPIVRARVHARVARVGALGLLWTPVAVLIPAAFGPDRWGEYALLVALCLSLGALTDRLPWPRAPLVPAVVTVVALTADALSGTQLLMRSLLGPNPAFGVRFYGIGNELKSGLAVLVFAGVASALYPVEARGAQPPNRTWTRWKQAGRAGRNIRRRGLTDETGLGVHRRARPAAAMAVAGIALAVVEGSARIGAGVGGVILVSAGTAVATLLLLSPRHLDDGAQGNTRGSSRAMVVKRALIVLAAPLAGLLLLAALDLASAHGGGHFTGSVLHARSAGDLRDIVDRRYSAAYGELKHGLMPLATALALLASVLGIRRRKRLLAPVANDPAWLAALAGGLTAGVVGALTEDSGPVLLVVAVFVLGCVLSYLRSPPVDA